MGALTELALPVALQKLMIHRKPDSVGYIHVKRKKFDDHSHLSLQILDAQGCVCVELEGFKVRSVVREQDHASKAELAYYTPQWKMAPISQQQGLMHSLCVVGGNDLFVSDLRKELPNFQILHLQNGPGYLQSDDDTYQLRLDEKEDYTLFIQAVHKRNISFSHFILCNDSELGIEAYINTRVHQSVVLFQCLMRQAKVEADLHFLLPYQYDPSRLEPAVMFTGLAKSLVQEHPRFQLHLVGLNSLNFAEQLVKEIKGVARPSRPGPGRDALVTLPQHVRYVVNERQVEHYVRDNTPQIPSTLPLRQKGVYLITGGLGGLGLIFAEYLAKTYQAKLVLTGRSELSADKQYQLGQLEKLGSETLYLQGDVTDRTIVEKWIKTTKDHFGSVQGIIHSAGIVEDRFLIQKDWKSFKSVISPKVLGAVHLDAATAEENLDCFVLFSSISSCFGNVGQTDYATGNAFLDTLASWRTEQTKQGKRFGRTLSINWPLWAEGGMRGNEMTIQTLKAIGLETLPNHLGIQAFRECLSTSGISQALVVYGNQNALNQSNSAVEGVARPSRPGPGRDALATLPAATSSPIDHPEQEEIVEEMKQEIIKAVACVLKFEPEAIHSAKELNIYGFDSISFTRLANQLKQIYGFSVSQNIFIENPTIERLAHYLWDNHTSQLIQHYSEKIYQTQQVQEAIPLVPEKTLNAVSIGQEQLFASSLLNPRAITYNIGMAVELIGELDIAALMMAINRLVQRYDAMRMSFIMDGEKIKGVIQNEINIDLIIKESSKTSLEAQIEEIDDAIKQLHREPFDLGKAPLFRCCLLQFPNSRYVFIYVVHHIITDGWSLALITKELSQNYNALLTNPRYEPLPLETSYRDFIHWQQQLILEREQSILDFWQLKLKHLPDPLQLPVTQQRTGTYRAGGEKKHFPKELAQKLKDFIKGENVSLFVCLLSAYQVLLARYANQSDLVIGVPFFGREEEKFENTIGYFINTLPLRAQLSEGLNFVELMKHNQIHVREAQGNQMLSLTNLISRLNIQRDSRTHPLFQVMFNYINMPISNLKLAGLQSRHLWSEEGQTEYDLNMTILEEKDNLELTLKYNADLFDKKFIQTLLENYLSLIENVISNPKDSVWNLELINKQEKYKLVEERNQTEISYEKDRTVHQLFEEQAEKTPHSIACVFENTQMTYQELNAKANQLAHYLREQGVKPNTLVGLSLDRGLDLAIGLLAVLKAGGAYVPLDPNYPKERLDFMLQDAKAAILLTQKKWKREGVLCIDIEDKALWKDLPLTNPDSLAEPSSLAYVIYTSGSTGKPKGVMMRHEALCNLLQWQKQNFAFNDQGNVLQFSALSFDVCFQECFSTWLGGSTLVLFSEDDKRDMRAVLNLLRVKKINRLFLPFVALSALVEQYKIQEDLLVDLREIITAGEQLIISTVLADFLKDHPQCTLVNQYGPSETHVVSFFTVSPPYSHLPPIGRPIANTSLYILDQNRQLVPEGVAGELYIGGKGVARGYLNRLELTQERFIENPFKTNHPVLYQTGDLVRYLPDGNIEYLGRLDEQVKIRGFRVELGEIEAAISSHAQIKQCVVIVQQENGDKRLIAYIVLNTTVPAGSMNVFISNLNEYLVQKLPSYMLPSAFIPLESLPLTPSGKVNRKALSSTSSSVVLHVKDSYAAPTNATELALTSLWSELLHIEQIGINDNFFNLGGHSLTGAQFIARVKNQYRIDLPLRNLFDHPTIESFAKLIEIALKQEQPSIPMLKKGLREEKIPLSFAQQRLWFLDQLIENKATYNIPVALKLTGRLNENALERSFKTLIDRHESLRTYFKSVGGEPQQVVSDYPFSFDRYDLSHFNAEEREKEVIALISHQAMEAFDLTKLPLMRVALVTLSPTEWALVITMHHIISDGWSLGILVKELNQFYNHDAYKQPLLLDELPVQYVDYTLWQRGWLKGDVLQNQLSYWHEQLKDAADVLNLPTDKPRAMIATHCGKVYQRTIHKNFTYGLKALGREREVTLFMILLALFQVLLHRYSHQEDIIIGSPSAGRKQKEIEGLIGFFVNTLVLRGNLAGNLTFTDLLSQVKNTTLEAYANQDIPFEQLVDHLKVNRQLDRHPLFQVMLVLQNTQAERMGLEDLEAALLPVDYQLSKFDLTFSFIEHENDDLVLTIEYATDLFYPDTIEKMADHFVNLMTAIIENADQPIHSLNLLTKEDEDRQLIEWNDTAKDYSREKTLHQLFEEQVERSPHQTALIFEEEGIVV